MQIKVNVRKAITGIPAARVVVSWGETHGGERYVTLFISAEDVYGIPTSVANLSMPPEQARELAARLLNAAGAFGTDR